MTVWNMKDLNDFIGECKVIVRGHAKKKGWLNRLANWSAKAWATLKWTWTDKQPFRDRLVLPAQSINIYLTSLTHVGMANMPLLMAQSGSRGLIGWNDQGQKDDRLHDWANIGFNVAFRERFGIKGAVLTSSIEDEVILYVLHLLKGGQPFRKLSSGTTKHKIQKTTVTKKAGSRSRSRGPLAMGRGDDTAKMYVMRKKGQAGRSSSEKVEIVEREWESESDSGGRKPMLALPAPDSDDAESVIEIKPREGRSMDHDDSDGWRGDGARSTSRTRRSRNDRRDYFMPPQREEAARDSDERGFMPSPRREAAYDSDERGFMPSQKELEAIRHRVLDEIQEEQQRAEDEMQREATQTALGTPVVAATEAEAQENARIIGTVA